MSKRVLLTGIGGFIGSHCLEYFLTNTDWEIIGIDSFRHKGTLRRIDEATNRHIDYLNQNSHTHKQFGCLADRFNVYYHDLAVPIDPQLENLIMSREIDGRGEVVEKKIDYIINMASDSAVERSIADPGHCWKNNCELIYNVLEFARKVNPGIILHTSTDEVFGDCPEGYSHHEWDTILPSNPYASSKAAQEALCIAYWRTYNIPLVLNNVMNNVGEWQDKEKFLPKLIHKIATGQEMEIYADFINDKPIIGSRYYLHAKNHADAIIFLLNYYEKNGLSSFVDGHKRPDRYNICGNEELDNLEVAQMVAKIMGKELKYKLVPSTSARKGYDRRYALDGSKLRDMGWKPPMTFEESLKNIVEWTMDNAHWCV